MLKTIAMRMDMFHQLFIMISLWMVASFIIL